jgi:hypothetical protein
MKPPTFIMLILFTRAPPVETSERRFRLWLATGPMGDQYARWVNASLRDRSIRSPGRTLLERRGA